MDWFAKAFIRASLAWLALGVSLGVGMAMHPSLVVYRAAHMHMNLLGFVAMMIFGVAYHVVPRFTGHPLHSRSLGAWHWWLANVALVLFVIGLAGGIRIMLIAGGVLSASGAYVFVYNVWRTLDGPGARSHAGVPLPVKK